MGTRETGTREIYKQGLKNQVDFTGKLSFQYKK